MYQDTFYCERYEKRFIIWYLNKCMKIPLKRIMIRLKGMKIHLKGMKIPFYFGDAPERSSLTQTIEAHTDNFSDNETKQILLCTRAM